VAGVFFALESEFYFFKKKLNKVEKWCKLKNLWFLKIINKDINNKEYLVDTSRLKSTNLENSNFYLVLGEDLDASTEEPNFIFKIMIYIYNLIYYYFQNIWKILFSELWW
jgi:hypothetical protein